MKKQKTNKNLDDGSGKKKQELSRKRRRKVIFSLFGVILFGALCFLWFFLRKTSVGVIRVGTPPNRSVEQGKGLKRFVGKYVSFSYPGAYVEKMHDFPIKGPVKESIFLSVADIEGRKIAIVVEEREGGDFEASPSFQMRLDTPKEYDQEPVSVSGRSGFLFKKNSQVFERTFFFHDKDFVVSVSSTSPFSAEDLERDLFAVIGSLRLRAR